MTTEEVLSEMRTAFMNDDTAAAVFGFNVGAAWEDTFSRVSVLGLIFYVTAAVYALVGRKLDDWKQDVSVTADETRYGTLPWWKKSVKEFQYGDSVSVIDGKVGYEEVNESKRIVTAATISTTGRVLTIRVAKGTGSGMTALTTDELTALQSYVDEIKPVGIQCVVRSGAASTLGVTAEVKYSGQRTITNIGADVNAALQGALDNLAFGGTLYVSSMVKALMDVDGVESVNISSTTMNGVAFDAEVQPPSGYAVVGTCNITYVAV